MAVLSQPNREEGDGLGKTSPVDFRLVIPYIGRYQRERVGFAHRSRWDRQNDLSNIYTQTASELLWLVTDEITWEQVLKDSRQLKMKP